MTLKISQWRGKQRNFASLPDQIKADREIKKQEEEQNVWQSNAIRWQGGTSGSEASTTQGG